MPAQALPIALGVVSALASLFGGSKGKSTGAAPWWEVGRQLDPDVLTNLFKQFFLNVPQGDPRALMMENLNRWLRGEISPIAYERAQETANRGLNTWMQMLGRVPGQASSGVGGALANAGAANWMRLANEAARDYSLAGEQARMQGTEGLMNLINWVGQIQSSKAGAVAGAPQQWTYGNDQNFWGKLGTAAGTAANWDWSKLFSGGGGLPANVGNWGPTGGGTWA